MELTYMFLFAYVAITAAAVCIVYLLMKWLQESEVFKEAYLIIKPNDNVCDEKVLRCLERQVENLNQYKIYILHEPEISESILKRAFNNLDITYIDE